LKERKKEDGEDGSDKKDMEVGTGVEKAVRIGILRVAENKTVK